MVVENEQTLCEIIKDGRILLKKASRGISKGKWNGLGGKLEHIGEPPEECTEREVFEETGLRVKNLFKHGVINFHFEGKKRFDVIVHLFSTKDFEGEIGVKEETDADGVKWPAEEVKWFDIEKIPFDEMWEDDSLWMGLVLKGRRFDSEFYFDESTKIYKYTINFLK
jgi:8-oxo-dGTP pyrophosphatase MutT (NUDIX family)